MSLYVQGVFSMTYAVLFLLLILPTSVRLLDNGLALTPPMGWLAWARFLCNSNCQEDPENCISERLFMDMADRLAVDGFKEVGYEYINIDDCWMDKVRDGEGRLRADPIRFPNGIKALADYVHSKGLKLGIYEDCGSKTCGGYPGSAGYFDIDSQTFAEWGVDMLKLDGCYADPEKMDTSSWNVRTLHRAYSLDILIQELHHYNLDVLCLQPDGFKHSLLQETRWTDKVYPLMTTALNKTGRPIVFSCSWPDYQRASGITPNYTKIAENCNLWRNFDDIEDSWESILSILDYYAEHQNELVPATGPGHWNDPDMVIIGNFGLSFDEAKAQMALWSIMASPLLMSNDLRSIAPEYKALLTNKEVIAVNQDALGLMGQRIYAKSSIEIWRRPITPVDRNGEYSYALVFFNRRTLGGPVKVTAQLFSIGLKRKNGYLFRNVFTDEDIGYLLPADNITVVVNPSGVNMVTAKNNIS